MKRKLYYTLLIVITASCMLYGTFRHILQVRSEPKEEFTNVAMENGSGEFNQQLSAFDSIKADVSVCSITIQHGETYSISGYYIKDMKSEFRIEGKTLIITQSSASEEHVLGVHRDDNGIVITVPEEVSLERLEINSEVSTLVIRNIDVTRLRVYNGTGDLTIDGMKTEYAMVVIDAGNIEMNDMDFERLHIRSGVSEVRVTTAAKLDDYHVILSTDAGNVKIGGNQFRGTYENETETGKVLEIRNGTGNVLVSNKTK